tara:strand:+ start:10349 stop:10762 length:414 start_codon:yes stop_codon:yes gene_type:complete
VSFKFPIKIYYADTDAMGLVYHANYLKFFDKARTELFNTIGISFEELKQDHTGFVVTHIDVQYKKAAQFEQSYEVSTKLVQCKKASLIFEQILSQDVDLYCQASIKIAYINLQTMKPIEIPVSIMQHLRKLEPHCGK